MIGLKYKDFIKISAHQRLRVTTAITLSVGF